MGAHDHASLRRAEVGARLRDVRERQGLGIADIAAATRIPERHLAAIERGDAGALPGDAYAAGFVRAYARILSLDAGEFVRAYRGEAELPPPAKPALPPAMAAPSTPEYPTRQEEDAARPLPIVPIAIGLAVLLLATLIAVIAWRPAPPRVTHVVLPDLAPSMPGQRIALPPARDDSVVLTARARVWLRVYEEHGKTLFDGLLEPGKTIRVPATARDPRLSTGWPGALAIRVGGAPVAPLGATRRIDGISLAPAALRAIRSAPSVDADADAGRRYGRDRHWHHRHREPLAPPDVVPEKDETMAAPAAATSQ
ncbi:MAG: DUF4115 domain-containing protein [Sphingomonadaceae bacterium]|nr:DUF4115 domain-containing protein [Sphingomonadaceae bacterium]